MKNEHKRIVYSVELCDKALLRRERGLLLLQLLLTLLLLLGRLAAALQSLVFLFLPLPLLRRKLLPLTRRQRHSRLGCPRLYLCGFSRYGRGLSGFDPGLHRPGGGDSGFTCHPGSHFSGFAGDARSGPFLGQGRLDGLFRPDLLIRRQLLNLLLLLRG